MRADLLAQTSDATPTPSLALIVAHDLRQAARSSSYQEQVSDRQMFSVLLEPGEPSHRLPPSFASAPNTQVPIRLVSRIQLLLFARQIYAQIEGESGTCTLGVKQWYDWNSHLWVGDCTSEVLFGYKTHARTRFSDAKCSCKCGTPQRQPTWILER